MGIIELIIAFLVGIGSSVTAHRVIERYKSWKSPSDTELMMSTIKVAERVSKSDPVVARKMIAEMKSSLIIDNEHLSDDLNGMVDEVSLSSDAARNEIRNLKSYYKRKKKVVDMRRRQLARIVLDGKKFDPRKPD